MNEAAFPSVVPDVEQEFSAVLGLTKREFFAALAMAGLLANQGDYELADATQCAVKAADKLINELKGSAAQ